MTDKSEGYKPKKRSVIATIIVGLALLILAIFLVFKEDDCFPDPEPDPEPIPCVGKGCAGETTGTPSGVEGSTTDATPTGPGAVPSDRG